MICNQKWLPEKICWILNEQWTSLSVYLSLFLISHPLPLPPPCSFLPLDTDMQRAGGFNEPGDDVTPPRWEFIIWSPLFQRPSLFSRAPRIRARSWLSFFPISPARRHRAVTDDVSSYRDEFFVVDVCRAWQPLVSPPTERVRASFTQVFYRLEFVTTISGTWAIKNLGYNNILVTRNRWRNFAKARDVSHIYVQNIKVPLGSDAIFTSLRGLFYITIFSRSLINCIYSFFFFSD